MKKTISLKTAFAVGFAAVAFAVLASTPASAQITRTWKGGSTSNNWNANANWQGPTASGTTPPTTNQLAVFDSTGNGQVNMNVNSALLGGVTINSPYTFGGANALQLASGAVLTNNATATLGRITVTSTGGTIGGSGLTTINNFGSSSGVGKLQVAGAVNFTNNITTATATDVVLQTGASANAGLLNLNGGKLTITNGDLSGYGDGATFMNVQANGVELNNGSTTMFLKDAGSYDQITSQDQFGNPGTLSYGGNLNLDLSVLDPAGFANFTILPLFNFGSESGDFNSVQFTNAIGTIYDGLTFSGPVGGVWTTGQASNGQSFYFNSTTGQLVVVPEPSTIVFAGVGLGMAGWSAWKKRRLARVLAKN